ncbi:MAG: hypothetical protein MUO82_00365 [Candidatus Thermoplasmatota archaeon]|nr:hypothetical protein [Candidatus Thermoplasmatota archaeon]
MMAFCKICNRFFDENYFFTLISYDDLGNVIDNYICKDCIKDKNKVNQLLDIADVELYKERNTFLNNNRHM